VGVVVIIERDSESHGGQILSRSLISLLNALRNNQDTHMIKPMTAQAIDLNTGRPLNS
jgi:signal transduction histidine kinase